MTQLLLCALMVAEGQAVERCPGHVVLSAYCGDQRPGTPDV
jgi:hypothetical protein